MGAPRDVCTACEADRYVSDGACVACSGACPDGQQETAPCYAGQSVVRVIFDSAEDDAADGTYFQQRKFSAAWDFWAAMRNAQRWTTGYFPAPTWVSKYGTDFVLTRIAESFDAATNTVTHDTEGDTTFGRWALASLGPLADKSFLEVSRHGGLLGDGVNNHGFLWIVTLDPSYTTFKNEPYENKSTIWLR